MADVAFLRTLIHEVAIKRPLTGSTGDGGLESAVFTDVYPTRKRCRIMPVTGSSHPSILGRFPDATHVMYCEKLDVRPNYRIELELANTVLSVEADVGATYLTVQSTLGLEIGSIIEVSDGVQMDQTRVNSMDMNVLEIEPPLAHAYAAGSTVRAVRTFDVLTREDEAGAGHHLRVIMRECEV